VPDVERLLAGCRQDDRFRASTHLFLKHRAGIYACREFCIPEIRPEQKPITDDDPFLVTPGVVVGV
jgi:hypothetical protein